MRHKLQNKVATIAHHSEADPMRAIRVGLVVLVCFYVVTDVGLMICHDTFLDEQLARVRLYSKLRDQWSDRLHKMQLQHDTLPDCSIATGVVLPRCNEYVDETKHLLMIDIDLERSREPRNPLSSIERQNFIDTVYTRSLGTQLGPLVATAIMDRHPLQGVMLCMVVVLMAVTIFHLQLRTERFRRDAADARNAFHFHVDAAPSAPPPPPIISSAPLVQPPRRPLPLLPATHSTPFAYTGAVEIESDGLSHRAVRTVSVH